jgi:H+-transporting ATPase
LAYGKYSIGFDLEQLRTLAFVLIVFGNQATTYDNRERRRLWSSRPSGWVVLASVVDVLIAGALAVAGLAMQPLPILIVAGTLAAAIAFAFILDWVKVPAFGRLKID